MNIKNQFLSKHDYAQKIAIVDVINDPSGLIVEYTLDGHTKAYSATPEELCLELVLQSTIEKYFPMAEGRIWVTFETVVDSSDRGIHKQRTDLVTWPLESFMDQFSQMDMILFIACIEYNSVVKMNVETWFQSLKTALTTQP